MQAGKVNAMRKIYLTEAKQHMTDKEKQLKKKLIKLLLDDGKGHHHKKYALRLKEFNVKIVSLKADPDFTAAISFDLGTIYISEGFLLDENLFYQLNVLIRHELAHNLLMHQIRMMAHIGKEYPGTWGNSPSLHNLLNIIEDMEISHKIYSKDDMETVRNMYLNGRVIGGIITEDQRPEWLDMPVETMYHQLIKEIEGIHAEIAYGIQQAKARPKNDLLTNHITNTISIYGDIQAMSQFDEPLASMAANNFRIHNKEIRPDFKTVLKAIYEAGTDLPYTEADVETMLLAIKNSSPVQITELIHPSSGELIIALNTPEQKKFAIEVLKKYRTEEATWYNAVMAVLKRNNYDAQTVKQIWARTRGTTNGE